jgi:hypothetical protein
MKYNTDLLKSVFTNIYTHNLWGSNESRSGIGSTKKYTEMNICVYAFGDTNENI